MTELEKEAEEQSIKYADSLECTIPKFSDEEGYCWTQIADAYEKGYIAGAHTIQWHDLRKDPEDLPKEEKTVQVLFRNCNVIREYNCIYDIHAKQWLYYNVEELFLSSFDYTVVAWCEIPKFEEKLKE